MKYLFSGNHGITTKKSPNQWLVILAACYAGLAFSTAHAEDKKAQKTLPPPPTAEAGFYPFGGGQELTVKAIASAKQTIFLAADGVTGGPITEALAEAHKRGVNIMAVLDKSQGSGRNSGASLLAREGIQVHIDHKHAIMHNNYMIIDGLSLEIGRINYTQDAAKKNADNVLLLGNNPDITKTYRANWQEHWDHSDPYK